MGEWKAQITLRIRQDLRREMEEYAARDGRKLGNVGAVVLEWAWEQLRTAGSIDRLLRFQIRRKKGHASGGGQLVVRRLPLTESIITSVAKAMLVPNVESNRVEIITVGAVTLGPYEELLA